MQTSLFSEFVDKYFEPTVRRLTEKYNDQNRESTLLHKQMLTEEYSPDLKWGATEINHSIVSADVLAMDSPLPLKSRSAISVASGDLPKLGIKYVKGEKLISDINVARARSSEEANVVAKIFDDVAKVIKSMDVAKEILFRRALSTGVALVRQEETRGTGIRVSFGFKEANMFLPTADGWTGKDPLPTDDLHQLFSAAEANGDAIEAVMISRAYFNAYRRSEQGKRLAASYNGQPVTAKTILPVAGRKLFLEALADEFGAEFIIVEGSFHTEGVDGRRKIIEAWEPANVVGIPSKKVGRLVYGTLAEETNPVKDVTYQKSGTHVLVSKYSKTDPLEEFTAGQAIVLPVIDNGGSIYLLHAEPEEKEEDVKDGDDKGEDQKTKNPGS